MMKLNHKQRYVVTLSGIVVLFVVAYHFAFAPTLSLYWQRNELLTRLSVINDAPMRLKQIQSQIEVMDKYLGDVPLEEINPLLVDGIGRLCESNRLLLREIPEKHVAISDKYTIVTHNVIVEGRFNHLITMLNQLEKHSIGGKLRACSFDIEDDFSTAQRKLVGSFYIQSIVKSEE